VCLSGAHLYKGRTITHSITWKFSAVYAGACTNFPVAGSRAQAPSFPHVQQISDLAIVLSY
jgi:hypothetical protein